MTDADRNVPTVAPQAPLPAAVDERLAQAQRETERGDDSGAMRGLADALALAPDNVEVLRRAATTAQRLGDHMGAVTYYRRAVQVAPTDADLHSELGIELYLTDNADESIRVLQRACELAPESPRVWVNLGEALRAQARTAEAMHALERALALDPTLSRVQLALAYAQTSVGEIDAAAARLREALRQDPTLADAWSALSNLRTVRFSADEMRVLERMLKRPDLPRESRIRMGFALAHALEASGDYARAFEEFTAANSAQRQCVQWDAPAQHQRVQAIKRAFAGPPAQAHADGRGHEVIFIASLPRSGSTLVEQILASHPQVEGANEIQSLTQLLETETRRRGGTFPDWVPAMTPPDWQRFGEDYLARTAHWRERKPRFTDKSLLNWLLVGAALTMLPSARVVVVHRDPVETCLACYRQWLGDGAAYTCNLEELAEFFIDFWHLSRFWMEKYPANVFDLEYEALLADPDATVRQVLAFCDLPFDPACLEHHRTQRAVLSLPSAAQVRQPLQRNTARAPHYGHRLDALRERLRDGGVPVTPG